jgi:lipopolysaccharide export system permease protein
MTLLYYLFKKFLPVFIGAVSFFSFVLVLLDLLVNIWSYISSEIPVLQVLYIEFLYIPKTISFAIPLSVLFASSYVLSDLYAKNELTSIFASGVSLLRFTLPLLVFAFLASIGLFYFEDRVVVPTYAKKIQSENIALRKNQSKNNDRIVLLAENGNIVFKADYYDDKSKKIFGLFIVRRDENHKLEKILQAESAIWRDTYWQINGYSIYKVVDGAFQTSTDLTGLEITEPPETFQSNVTNIETVNISDSKVYLAHLKRTGLPSAESLSQYYKKYSFPFIVFIVVFLSIGLSGRTRKNVLLVSLGLCLASAVGFYVLQMVTMLFARFGVIPPAMGAWFPVVSFVIISIILLRFSRT